MTRKASTRPSSARMRSSRTADRPAIRRLDIDTDALYHDVPAGLVPQLAVMNIDAGAPSRWLPGDGPGSGDELDRLAELHREGLAVAPIMLVPAEAQENFYRYGNLVQQLSELFLGVDPADPDEDDLEERAPQAMALITGSYLLDEVIDRFYDTVNLLPRSRRVRRPGEEGLLASGNRASLLALKRIWASDWSFASLVSRLEAERSFRLEA